MADYFTDPNDFNVDMGLHVRKKVTAEQVLKAMGIDAAEVTGLDGPDARRALTFSLDGQQWMLFFTVSEENGGLDLHFEEEAVCVRPLGTQLIPVLAAEQEPSAPSPSLDEPCPADGRKGRHEVYVNAGPGGKRDQKLGWMCCQACGANGPMRA